MLQYLDPTLQTKLKHWSNGSVAKLRVGDMVWEVRLLRNRNSLRFGAGWNNFIEDNQLKEEQHLRYMLVNATDKIFDVTI